uniref:Uncharacterized protein LOC113786344 n=1 Tax=Cicer arietinum TaxID=3827 RepID=A0A3Q7YAR3_CICAR|nr:uncharacterized protein LOC113786344 [Cicer arietinum]
MKHNTHPSFNYILVTKANIIFSLSTQYLYFSITNSPNMGGNNQRKSKSSSFKSVFNIFKSSSNKQRGYDYYDDDCAKQRNKVWPSDEDRGSWGVADPTIDMRATAFIAQYKKRITESEIHWQAQPDQ